MNLFILDSNLDTNAEYHVDKHVTKMQLEAAQMLCTVSWVDLVLGYIPRKLDSTELATLKKEVSPFRALSQEERPFPYLPTHPNHPSSIWVRTSLDNYYWTCVYAHSLNSEQYFRFGTSHKSMEVINKLPLPTHLKELGLTPFALAMPDQYADSSNPIQSYRNYYSGEKVGLAKWTGRGVPNWF